MRRSMLHNGGEVGAGTGPSSSRRTYNPSLVSDPHRVAGRIVQAWACDQSSTRNRAVNVLVVGRTPMIRSTR
jgi:hypothetical protein